MIEEDKIYLTEEGLKKFEQEFASLKQTKKLKANEERPTNASLQGVDSEFFSFEEDLSLLESRIEELDIILKNYTLIAIPVRTSRKIISMGATVVVEVQGQKDEFTIVGSLEANPMLGRISNKSPVGMSLLGHRVGDDVRVQSAVVTVYKIKKIVYKL